MITELSLKGFKCFQNLESISLGRINLFTGSNGRGKSTFLQSLLLLAQSIDNEKRLNHIKLNGKFIELGTFDDVCCRYETSKSSTITFKTDDKEENSISVTFARHDRKQRWAKLTHLKSSDKELIEETGSARGETNSGTPVLGATTTISGLVQLHNVYFISADRKGPIDYIKKNDNDDDRQIGIHGEFLINALSKIGEDFTQKVSKEASKILSGATVLVKDTETDYLQFYLDSEDESKGFRPSNVGFGYSYVLPIITSMLLAERGAKVFIENPEAHLHPGAQSRLIDFLVKQAKEKEVQLFIETHSDHIINGLRIAVSKKELNAQEAHIIHFNRHQPRLPKVFQIRIDNNGNLSEYPQEFMDEWGIQMSQLV